MSKRQGQDSEEVYEKTLEHVNDGLPVDWKALEAEHPELADRWHRLRRVQEVNGAFREAQREDGSESRSPTQHPATVGETAGASHSDFSETWGHLVLMEKIGEGTFGEVFRARDPILERDVALKLARRDHVGIRGFLDEGRRLALIDHPGVIRVHGAATHEGRAGVWMDLAEGRALDARLDQDGRLSEREVLDIARQLAAALAAVHACDLVHGDVKAANVLRRDGGELVLGDFGSSLDLRQGRSTAASASPLTAAPEVLRGDPADPRSDIYSLGVLLFQLLTRAYPFEANTSSDLIEAHRLEERPSLRELRPSLGRRTCEVVERAIALDPKARWQTAQEFGEAIERCEVRSDERRGPRGLALTLVAVLLVLAGSFALNRFRSPTQENPELPEAERVDQEPRPTSETNPTFAAIESMDSLQVGLYRASEEQALKSGDAVFVGDALHLRVSKNDSPLWLYLVNEDSTGTAFTLFPIDGMEPSNPLAAGDLRLPGRLGDREQDWLVTSAGSAESFLLVASRSRLPNLEQALLGITEASVERSMDPQTTGTTRSVGGVRPAVEDVSPSRLLALQEVARTEGGVAPHLQIVTLRGERR